VLKVLPVIQEHKAAQDLQEHKAAQDLQEHKAAQDLQEHKEPPDLQEHKVPLDLQEPRARPVLKGLLVVLAVLVLKAPLAVSAIPKVLFTVWFLVVNYTTLNKKGSITWQPQI
jgi:hypothetical protein